MELNIISKKIVCLFFCILLSFTLCACSLNGDSANGITLSYNDFLMLANANEYTVSEYQMSLDNYPVQQIDIQKGDKFLASYEVFSSTDAVEHIYKNLKKYYKTSSCKLTEKTDDKMVFKSEDTLVTIIKSNLTILTMEDNTSNAIQSTNLLNLIKNYD